jgi:hypothetical protein
MPAAQERHHLVKRQVLHLVVLGCRLRLSMGVHPLQTSGVQGRCALYRAASTTLCTNAAMVIGPTPPGTGVRAPATLLASSKATSPTRRASWLLGLACVPLAAVCRTTLMPTSMTTAPGFIQLALHREARSQVDGEHLRKRAAQQHIQCSDYTARPVSKALCQYKASCAPCGVAGSTPY